MSSFLKLRQNCKYIEWEESHKVNCCKSKSLCRNVNLKILIWKFKTGRISSFLICFTFDKPNEKRKMKKYQIIRILTHAFIIKRWPRDQDRLDFCAGTFGDAPDKWKPKPTHHPFATSNMPLITIWDSYTHRQIHHIEIVQHHAAIFPCGNYYSRGPGGVTNVCSCPGMGDSGNTTSN